MLPEYFCPRIFYTSIELSSLLNFLYSPSEAMILTWWSTGGQLSTLFRAHYFFFLFWAMMSSVRVASLIQDARFLSLSATHSILLSVAYWADLSFISICSARPQVCAWYTIGVEHWLFTFILRDIVSLLFIASECFPNAPHLVLIRCLINFLV